MQSVHVPDYDFPTSLCTFAADVAKKCGPAQALLLAPNNMYIPLGLRLVDTPDELQGSESLSGHSAQGAEQDGQPAATEIVDVSQGAVATDDVKPHLRLENIAAQLCDALARAFQVDYAYVFRHLATSNHGCFLVPATPLVWVLVMMQYVRCSDGHAIYVPSAHSQHVNKLLTPFWDPAKLCRYGLITHLLLGFAMGRHKRLGECSIVNKLPVDAVELIFANVSVEPATVTYPGKIVELD